MKKKKITSSLRALKIAEMQEHESEKEIRDVSGDDLDWEDEDDDI